MAWSSKIKWTAAEWRDYRRRQGIPPKADMPTLLPPHIFKAGQQLSAMLMLPVLDWHPGLFEDITMTTANSTAPLLQKPTNERICPCGCGMQHNMASESCGGLQQRP